MTETVQIALIGGLTTAVPTSLAVILTAWAQGRKRDAQATAATAATEEVKATLAENTATTAGALAGLAITAESSHQLAEKTHTLVNSNMQAQLKVGAAALRRVAGLTKDPADDRIATEAERLLAEHVSKQADVDRAS